MSIRILILSVAWLVSSVKAARLAGECAMICNDLRTDVLTMEMCADAKKTLPRPKVGDFCSVAMEQGFSDACVNLCVGQPPVPRLAETCRSAAIEMPRPTVRKWCEHGYTVGFQKTIQDLRNHFQPPKIEEIQEPIIESIERFDDRQSEPIQEEFRPIEPIHEEIHNEPVFQQESVEVDEAFHHDEEFHSSEPIIEDLSSEEFQNNENLI